MKRQPIGWENIFVNHIFDRESNKIYHICIQAYFYISRMYKELMTFNSKGIKT